MIALIFFVACIAFAAAYVFYGGFLERTLNVSRERVTPAHTMQDGVDYVPTATPILFGHHFSSIAGAGPIVGPIIAGLAFGWLPSILWIVVGAIFVGGVHDFTSLIASIRHKGRSVGELCKDLLSPLAYYLFLVFIWLTMMYIQIVFIDLTSSTFAPVSAAAAAADEAAGLQARQGGAVATASLTYIALACLFGLATYRFKLKIWAGTLIFVPLVFLGLWFGNLFPLVADRVPVLFGSAKNTWNVVLIAYCFLASILPVWILLQPRDYLSSFLLYACVAAGVAGLLISGALGHIVIRYPAFVTFNDPQLKFIFPALFVTIACGAVSGFHSIVASGTTSKQLISEHAARPIGYGSMLIEGVLALIALAGVMILADKPSGQTPVAIFAGGLSRFLAAFGVSRNLAVTFGMLAVSTFLLTTLDTCTRLARFIFEEIFNFYGWAARLAGTAASLVIPAFVVFRQIPGPGGKLMPAWQAIWPAFGATNQLMAALALLVVFTWLREEKKVTAWYVLIPLVFMAVTTLTALAQLVVSNLATGGSRLVGGLSAVLWVLAVALIIDAVVNLRKRKAL